AASRVTANASDAIAIHHDLFDREALSQLGAGRNRCVNQNFIKHLPPRAVSLNDAVRWRGRTGKGELADVELNLEHGRAVGSRELIEQPPAFEPGHAGLPDDVSGHNVAGEGGLIH